LERLTRVRNDCLGKPKDEEDKDGDLDNFTRLKKGIGKKIKKIREVIKVRDNLLTQKLNEEAIKRSNTARIMIADVYADAEQLNCKIEKGRNLRKEQISSNWYSHIFRNAKCWKGRVKLFELKSNRPKEQETKKMEIMAFSHCLT